MCKINYEFGFNSNKKHTIKQVKESLDSYSSNFESALKLDGSIPIFLDTNILLNYYGMSSSEKGKLLEFINATDNIYITKQIETEFIRNRVGVINEYFTSVKKIKDIIENDLIKDIKNKFKSVLNNKILKADFNENWQDLDEIYSELETKLFENEELKTKVNASVDSLLVFNKHLKIKDDILSHYQEIDVIDGLDDDELKFLKAEFKKLFEMFKQAKENQKYKLAFPGCGEKKIVDEADGDFIIFHEILKFMKVKQTDAIFLTNDISKNDWISKDGEPFIHYIEKTFLNTEHNLYIFNAERILSTIDFENIYDFDYEEQREISVNGTLTVKCEKCNEIFSEESDNLDLDFEVYSVDERKMGPEYSHRAEAYLECPKCKSDIIVSFELWEYPVGVHNYDEIEIENGELLEKPTIEYQ